MSRYAGSQEKVFTRAGLSTDFLASACAPLVDTRKKSVPQGLFGFAAHSLILHAMSYVISGVTRTFFISAIIFL